MFSSTNTSISVRYHSATATITVRPCPSTPADSPNFDRTLRSNVSQTYGVYIRRRRSLTPERMLFIAHCLHIHVPIKQSLYIINNIAAFSRQQLTLNLSVSVAVNSAQVADTIPHLTTLAIASDLGLVAL